MKTAAAMRFLILVLLVLLAYAPAYRTCGFIWDDDGYVEENKTLRSTVGLREIWLRPGATPQYYPLVFTTFWVEYHLWGLRPMGYHIVNVLLHGLNSGLLWLLLRRLNVSGAWFAAAIFALHPVHVESVAWVTERKNVLSGFFCLLAFLAYLRFAPPERPEEKPAWRWYAVSLGLFLAALLSKTITCSLPAVLVLVYWWKRDKGRGTTDEKRESSSEQRPTPHPSSLIPQPSSLRNPSTFMPLFALLPMFILGALLARQTSYLEKNLVGAEGEDWDFSLVERCLIAGRALCFYAGKLFWPHPLIFSYPRWHIDAADPWQYVYPSAVVVFFIVLTWLTFTRRLGRGPLTACLIFAGTLLPALGFFNVYPMIFSFVADHFQYLPSTALIALTVAAVFHLDSGRRRLETRPARWLAASLLIVLGWLTYRQCDIYRDRFTIFADTLTKNPESWMAQANMGTIWAKKMNPGNPEIFQNAGKKALEYFGRTIELNPRFSQVYSNRGDVLMDLADNAKARGHDAEAQRLFASAQVNFEQALLLEERLPLFKRDAGKYDHMVKLQRTLGKEETVLHFQLKIVEIIEARSVWFHETRLGQDPDRNPEFGDVLFRCGELLKKRGRTQEAEQLFDRSVAIFRNILEGLQATGQESSAEGAQAHFDLSFVLRELGRPQEALPHLERANALRRQSP